MHLAFITISNMQKKSVMDETKRVKGVFMSYRAAILFLCLVSATVLAVTGYAYARWYEKARLVDREHAMQARLRRRNEALFREYRTLLEQTGAGRYGQRVTAAEAEHMRAVAAMQTGSYGQFLEKADALLKRPDLTSDLRFDLQTRAPLAHVLRREYGAALIRLDDALSEHVDAEPLLRMKIDILLHLRQFDNAAETLEPLERRSMGPAVQFARGTVAWGRGDMDAARDDYDVVLASGHPELVPAAAANLALLHAGRDDGERARFHLGMLLKLRPERWSTLLAAGRVFLALGDAERAGTALEAASALRPEDPDVLLALAALRESAGEPQRAEMLRERAVAVDASAALRDDALAGARIFLFDVVGEDDS